LLSVLRTLAWLACVVYSTIPGFWLLIHPFAEFWRSRRSPYRVLLPAWLAMWVLVAWVTRPWRHAELYSSPWTWLPALVLFVFGLWCYRKSSAGFSASQLGGLSEIRGPQMRDALVRNGIRARARHPVYLAHLCEMLAWSIGTGLLVCYCLTAFALLTGTWMVRLEDAELERRFGEEFRRYRQEVPAVIPRF
jgi:protein-S-isoprenylcysteine O-methyltransferase Ste14